VTNFRPGAVDYERQAENYSRGRYLTERAAASWREAVQRHLQDLRPNRLLDLGSGTGRFSLLLAQWLSCRVVGVEPSSGMRTSALVENSHPSVDYVGGNATAIPLANYSCDAAWLAFMVHHVPDRQAAARELGRVVRPGGIVLVTGAYTSGRSKISLFKYFPSAAKVAERFVKAPQIVADFEAGGLDCVAQESVESESVSSLREAAARTALRADSTLQLITDEEFAAGQRTIEKAAANEREPRPVVDEMDLLVFRAPA
jgi:ubiquinone/menaquinone biosynthesis C-methylase UbiE